MSSPKPMDPEVAQAKLDELEADIQRTRRQVENDLSRPADEQKFVDSGSEGGDDQTIAP